MTTTAREPEGGDFTPAPEGTHLARCVQVIDIGTQYSAFYRKSTHKIVLGWELPEVLDGDRPHLVWKRYSLSLHKNAVLRAHLESWRGRKFSDEELEGFDLRKLLGVPCMIAVTHSDDGQYANVAAVLAVPKGVVCPDQINDSILFDLDEFDESIFETFSGKLQKTIESSAERKVARGEVPDDSGYSEAVEDDPAEPLADGDIPF